MLLQDIFEKDLTRLGLCLIYRPSAEMKTVAIVHIEAAKGFPIRDRTHPVHEFLISNLKRQQKKTKLKADEHYSHEYVRKYGVKHVLASS